MAIKITPGSPPSLFRPAPEIPPTSGAVRVADRAAFDALARRDDVPGAVDVLEVKFLLVGVDGDAPRLYFINTRNHPYHYDFAANVLRMELSLEDFNAKTYFTGRRKNLAGSVIAHDRYVAPDGTRGVYALEFWPTDPVKAPMIAVAYRLIRDAMPFASALVKYHPAGETQDDLYEKEQGEFGRRRVPVITTRELFERVEYSALNQGEGYGRLVVFDGGALSARDVVIFRTAPNDLTHVAAIITETPQTPLSHINLKARQDRVPNAYVKGASSDPRFTALLGKDVHLRVEADEFELREATAQEVDDHLQSLRPREPQTPVRDLIVNEASPLGTLGHASARAYGAKTANLAELRKVLPKAIVPDGFGLPFRFYDEFMKSAGLYEDARGMMNDADFRRDPARREDALKDFRKRVKDADVPSAIDEAIEAVREAFPARRALRCRSSTNNEDLVGFIGAGLYDSYTHRADEGRLSKTVRQVWASLWNFRAFEEREFYRVNHLAAAIGVLIHPNTDDERSNGVAVTRNIYDPNWPGFYVNAQVGESLVTNPDPGAVPEEFLVSAIGPNGEYEVQYIRRSSLVEAGEAVLTRDEVDALVRAMERIQRHFKAVYKREDDPRFAMDIEFKVEKNGALLIKQARPLVG